MNNKIGKRKPIGYENQWRDTSATLTTNMNLYLLFLTYFLFCVRIITFFFLKNDKIYFPHKRIEFSN